MAYNDPDKKRFGAGLGPGVGGGLGGFGLGGFNGMGPVIGPGIPPEPRPVIGPRYCPHGVKRDKHLTCTICDSAFSELLRRMQPKGQRRCKHGRPWPGYCQACEKDANKFRDAIEAIFKAAFGPGISRKVIDSGAFDLEAWKLEQEKKDQERRDEMPATATAAEFPDEEPNTRREIAHETARIIIRLLNENPSEWSFGRSIIHKPTNLILRRSLQSSVGAYEIDPASSFKFDLGLAGLDLRQKMFSLIDELTEFSIEKQRAKALENLQSYLKKPAVPYKPRGEGTKPEWPETSSENATTVGSAQIVVTIDGKDVPGFYTPEHSLFEFGGCVQGISGALVPGEICQFFGAGGPDPTTGFSLKAHFLLTSSGQYVQIGVPETEPVDPDDVKKPRPRWVTALWAAAILSVGIVGGMLYADPDLMDKVHAAWTYISQI